MSLINDGLKVFERLKLWQILLTIGVAAPALSHYGWNIGVHYAILLLVGFAILAIIVRYFPPPDTSKPGPKISISPHQTAFCAQFDQWVEFTVAAEKFKGPDDDEKLARHRVKNRELRIELGTAQGLINRKLENGKHYIQFHRAEDATTYVPSD